MDLLSSVKATKNVSQLNADYIIRKFSSKAIHIYYNPKNDIASKALRFFNIMGTKASYYVHRDRIEIIDDFQLIKDTLRYLGNFIRKINVRNFNGDKKHSEEIMKLINQYCSESLIEMEILFNDSNFNSLKYATKPFESVEHISIGGYIPKTDNISSIGLNNEMNQIFPALRNISLAISSPDNEYINCHFPHLKYAHVFVHDINFVNEFLRLNPQIKSLELGKASPETLRKLNEMFPTLERLTLESSGMIKDEEEEEEITFNNVTAFTMNYSDKNSGKHLHFPSLQQFDIDLNHENSDDWVKFMTNHRQISRFHLKYSYYIADNEFQALTAELPNLMEMSVSHTKRVGDSIGADVIIKFMESHEKLLKFNINACKEEDKPILQEKLADKWTILSRGNRLFFERIQ